MTRLPQLQMLALSYSPQRARPKIEALLLLEQELAAIFRAKMAPLAAQIRLAWWRNELAGNSATWPAGADALGALETWQRPGELGSLPDAWEQLTAEKLTAAEVAAHIDGRATSYVSLGEELGLVNEDAIRQCARLWIAGDLYAHLSDDSERRTVAGQVSGAAPIPKLPKALRSLGVLAGFGRHALRTNARQLPHGMTALSLAIRHGLRL